MSIHRNLLVSLSLLCSINVNAGTAEQWQFSITPVLWNASVKAQLTDNNGGGGEPVNSDYNFFSLENLSDYLSLQAEAKHGRFSLLFDSLRARYQDDAAGKFINLDVSTELGFIELAAAYQLSDKYKLDLTAGVRRTFLDVMADFKIGAGGTFPAINEQSSSSWNDPIIGLRYNYLLSDNWQLWLRGDVGGFGVGTKRSINALANAQYIFNDYVSFIVGYRYLEIDFKEEDVLQEVKLKGVYLGVGMHF